MGENSAEKTCKGCGAKCCRELNFDIEDPKTDDDFDSWKWILSHNKVYIYKDPKAGWCVCFDTDCKFLDEKSQCKIYDKRHKLCEKYSHEECVRYTKLKYEPVLRTIEDVENLRKSMQK